MTFSYEYPRPSLTVDAVVLTLLDEQLRVLLIRRRAEPCAGQWALPGGFVNDGENLLVAAKRELLEETKLAILHLWPLEAFGDQGRDPRGWTASMVYYGFVSHRRSAVSGSDDADAAEWLPVSRRQNLAFDHEKILKHALQRMRRELYSLPIAQPLLPTTFTMGELLHVYRQLDPKTGASTQVRARLLANQVIRPSNNRFRFIISRSG